MVGTTTLDSGHDQLKAKIDLDEHMIPQYSSPIEPARFDALARETPGPNPNFIQVRNPQHGIDGYFSIGDGAARTGLSLERGRRYRPDYVGVMMCGVWAHHYYEGQPGYRQQRVTTLFPAADWHAVDRLRAALSGNWTINVMNGETLRFSVKKRDVVALPEPMGGFYNVILDQYGNQHPEWRSNGYNPALIDAGAATLQVVPMGARYQLLDPERIGVSYPLGVNKAVEDFILGLYELEAIEDTASADRLLYRHMIRTGRWTGRGPAALVRKIDDLMAEILDHLMVNISRHLSAHDLLAHSHIILTGGGSGLLARPLLRLLLPGEEPPDNDNDLVAWAMVPDRSIYFADHLQSIQFANSRGAEKTTFVG